MSGLRVVKGKEVVIVIDPTIDFDYKTYKARVTLDARYLVVDILYTNCNRSDDNMQSLADKVVRKFGFTEYKKLDYYRAMVIRDGMLVPSGRSFYSVKGIAKVPMCASIQGTETSHYDDVIN